MDDDLYSDQIGSEIPQHDNDAIADCDREAKLSACMERLAHTMLMLSHELTEAAKSSDAIDLRYAASLIMDTRKASELSKELIARKVQLR
jgi:hypothetical protein